MGLDNQNIRGADEMLKKLQEAKRYIKEDVPEIIGTEAVNHFKQNFHNEGFDNKKWASRKSKRTGGTNGQKILTKSGELSESIDYRVEGNTIIIYSDKLYAQIHNEGGIIPVTAKMKGYFFAKAKELKEAGETDVAEMYIAMALSKEITIEQRQFMGESDVLMQKISARITKDLTNILK